MQFLDTCGVVAGDDDAVIRDGSNCAAVFTGQQNSRHAVGFGGLEGLADVLGVAAGREADEDVVRLAERFDLAGKDLVVAVVVGDAGEHRGVGIQRNRRQWPPLTTIAADQLFAQVHGVGRAAAVATGIDGVACVQALDHQLPSGFNLWEEWLDGLNALLERLIIGLDV